MKTVLKLIVLLIINFSYSQNKKIEVEYNFIDAFRGRDTESILICNNSNSIFTTKLEKYSSNKAVATGNGNIMLNSTIANPYQVMDKNKKELTTFKMLNEDVLKITESIPNFKWKLDYTEIKKIKKYNCNKATVKFRGRNYTAWYTSKIPISFGPWKFSGLPGLILKISDDTKTFTWEAIKIKYPTKKEIKIPYKSYTEFTIKEYMDKRAENLEKMRARVRSILPRGATFNKPKNPRNGIELTFEWETW